MILTTLRHYVGNEKQASEFETMTERIIKAKSKSPDIEYRMSLNWPDPKEVSEKVRDIIKKLTNKLYDKGITIESYQGFGIGYAFFKGVFNYLAEANRNYKDNRKILFLVDGDQFDVSDDRVINGIKNIADKITSDNRIIGLALRDYLKLSDNEYKDELRKIEELYHLNVCPEINISNPQNIDIKDIHPAYLEYGDVVSGLIGFNLNSEIFKIMLPIIHQDIKRTDLTEYQVDPYIIMLAGILTKEKSEAGFYSEVIPTLRTTRGSRFEKSVLTKKAKSLKQTFVGKYYKESVEDYKFEKVLTRYFKLKSIKETKKRILDGLC